MDGKRENLALLLFIVAAFIPRLTLLSFNPPGLFRDEVEKLYHSWTFWNHGGETLEGEVYPLFIEIEGATTSGIYHYFSAVFTMAGFPTALQGRLIIALVGIITICAFITLLGKLFSGKAALLAGILFVFSPWHFLFSRWIQQGIFLPLFLAAFLLFFHNGKVKKWSAFYFMSGLSLGLAMYSYAIAIVLVPLIMVGLIVLEYRHFQWRTGLAFLAGLALLAVPVLHQQAAGVTGEASRFARISVFNAPSPWWEFIINYLQHLSPWNLFITGDNNLRHSYPYLGMFHWYTLPFFAGGLIYLIRNRDHYCRLILWLLLVSPVPASLTMEGIPHYLRAIPLLLMVEFIIETGMIKVYQDFPRFFRFYAPLIAINLLVFMGVAFYFYPVKSLPLWDADFFDMALKEGQSLQAEYNRPFYISEHILYREYMYGYFNRLSPEQFHAVRDVEVYFTSREMKEPYLELHYRYPFQENDRTPLCTGQNPLFMVSLVGDKD